MSTSRWIDEDLPIIYMFEMWKVQSRVMNSLKTVMIHMNNMPSPEQIVLLDDTETLPLIPTTCLTNTKIALHGDIEVVDGTGLFEVTEAKVIEELKTIYEINHLSEGQIMLNKDLNANGSVKLLMEHNAQVDENCLQANIVPADIEESDKLKIIREFFKCISICDGNPSHQILNIKARYAKFKDFVNTIICFWKV